MFKLLIIAAVALFAVVLSAPAATTESTNSEATAEVLKFESDNSPDGSYAYAYETSNNIAGQESGVGGERAAGGYKWVSPEGQTIDIQYVADADGFRATGDALPVGPPQPEYITRLLEWLEAHPSDDDGSYKA